MSVFLRQNLLQVSLDTKQDLSTATVTRILYQKPNGEKGYWNGNVNGTKIEYNFTATDITHDGPWKLQAFITVGGKDGYGEIVDVDFKKSLK